MLSRSNQQLMPSLSLLPSHPYLLRPWRKKEE